MTTSTEEHHWTTERDRTIELFNGEQPGPQLEQDCIDRFVEDPERFIRTRDQIATQHSKKPFNSAWAILRSTLNRTPKADITVTASASRQRLIDQGKHWIRNAGAHHPTWNECANELFGDATITPPLDYLEALELHTRDAPGRRIYDSLLTASITRTKAIGQQPVPEDRSAQLHSLRNDQAARQELQDEWTNHRPAAIQAEQDHEAWNAKAKHDRTIIIAGKDVSKYVRTPTSEDIDFT